jgi:hypothetical protein
MSEFLSLLKLVKETRTSTCTRIIAIERRSRRIAVRVNEHLTDWVVGPFPARSQKFSSKRSLNLVDAEAYARSLLDASLEDGFVRAL